ncbi:WD repeat-containing protein 47 [Caerostris darwini]|uniref:WD repeat-containing protein 47 n=1 Tax=Caerostris darwini TaxID=1538125 RepID=A0AAV4QF07_9ARAC|nr:WD repeat-containing protein 47 [Caerostris darwini]
MTTDTICLKEADIIRLIQSYLSNRGLHLSLDALERETGILNCQFPEEALVLRHLIVDGRWRDALNYIGRLPLKEEDIKYMTFEIMKQKYVELICVYEELGNELYEDLGHAIALCFSELSTYCPCPVEYENLRKLASLTKLSQDAQYKDWNPISSRRQCFQTICSVLLDMQGLDEESSEQLIDPNRLINLLVKGILYESCEQYCEDKAIAQSESTTFRFGCLMNDEKFRSSLSLYSWLQSVPWITMVNSFADRSLTVELDKLDQPPIKKSWTEKILQNSTDLPEDVNRELRRPMSCSEDLKENFWNRRIQNNLIVDAPEILRRAEEVISRWEQRNRGNTKQEACKMPPRDAKMPSRNSKINEISRIPNSSGDRNLDDCKQEGSKMTSRDEKKSPRHGKINEINHLPDSGGDWNLNDCKQEAGKMSSRGVTMPSRDVTMSSRDEKRSPRHGKINEINRLSDFGGDWNLDDCKEETGKLSPRDAKMFSRDGKINEINRIPDSNSNNKKLTRISPIKRRKQNLEENPRQKNVSNIAEGFPVPYCDEIESNFDLNSFANKQEIQLTKIDPNCYDCEGNVIFGINQSSEQNNVFDEKQNIRDLLEAKSKVRSKLLKILKNSTNDQNQTTTTDGSEESPKNVKDQNQWEELRRLDFLNAIQQPFFVQPNLLRREEGNLKQIFNTGSESTSYKSSSVETM